MSEIPPSERRTKERGDSVISALSVVKIVSARFYFFASAGWNSERTSVVSAMAP
jgi:hypothetical protein